MYERLSSSELGLSEEIRQRIDRTLYEDQFDSQTRELAVDIMQIADMVKDTKVAWHENPRAFEAFSVAVAEWLKVIEPKWRGGAADDLLGPMDPGTLGLTIARSYRRIKDWRGSIVGQIGELQQRQQKGGNDHE
jgi:hypothetical protein